MRKLYLVSNYHSECYDINENDTITIRRRDEEPFDLTIDGAVDLFRQCPSVACFGIIKAVVQQRNEEVGKWEVLKSVL